MANESKIEMPLQLKRCGQLVNSISAWKYGEDGKCFNKRSDAWADAMGKLGEETIKAQLKDPTEIAEFEQILASQKTLLDKVKDNLEKKTRN